MSPKTIDNRSAATGRFTQVSRGAPAFGLRKDVGDQRLAEGTQGLAQRLLTTAGEDEWAEVTGRDVAGHYAGRAQAGAEMAWLLGDPDRTADGSFHGGRALLRRAVNHETLPDAPAITSDRVDRLAEYALLQAFDAHQAMDESEFATTSAGAGTEQEQADRSRSHYLSSGRREGFVAAYAEVRFAHLSEPQRSTVVDQMTGVLTTTEDLEFQSVLDADADLQEHS